MPIHKRRKSNKRYLIWAILIVLVILMIISFSTTPEFTEIELISSGGGVGFSSSTWGSEKTSLKYFKKLFLNLGFKEVE